MLTWPRATALSIMQECLFVCSEEASTGSPILGCSPSHSFCSSLLCLSLFLTFSSPSRPGAPDRPLLSWLDFSLVNSQRLSVTSSRSPPAWLDFFIFFSPLLALHLLLQERRAWHAGDTYCHIWKLNLPDRSRSHRSAEQIDLRELLGYLLWAAVKNYSEAWSTALGKKKD